MHTTTLRPRSPLVDRWQRQIGRRLRLDVPVPRPFAALDLLVRGGDREGLVPIDRLTFVLLHDVVDPGVHDGHRLRLAGYGIEGDPCGVAIGGAEAHRFEKNLALEPLRWSRDERVDADDAWMLRLGLRMDRRVERHSRSRRAVEFDRPALPSFWAAFPPEVALDIVCDGPEWLGVLHESGRSADELVASHRRELEGLVLLPVAWVSHVVEEAITLFADLDGLARRQLFRLSDAEGALVGFRGACQFDFLSSRFSPIPLKETA